MAGSCEIDPPPPSGPSRILLGLDPISMCLFSWHLVSRLKGLHCLPEGIKMQIPQKRNGLTLQNRYHNSLCGSTPRGAATSGGMGKLMVSHSKIANPKDLQQRSFYLPVLAFIPVAFLCSYEYRSGFGSGSQLVLEPFEKN
jgi:hypothetical protein